MGRNESIQILASSSSHISFASSGARLFACQCNSKSHSYLCLTAGIGDAKELPRSYKSCRLFCCSTLQSLLDLIKKANGTSSKQCLPKLKCICWGRNWCAILFTYSTDHWSHVQSVLLPVWRIIGPYDATVWLCEPQPVCVCVLALFVCVWVSAWLCVCMSAWLYVPVSVFCCFLVSLFIQVNQFTTQASKVESYKQHWHTP